MITLYSTNCPQCKIVEKLLNDAGYEYDLVSDVQLMIDKGFSSAPMVDVDGQIMNAQEVFQWLNNSKNG